MRQNKYQIHIGDVLYEASFTYRKVIEWEITDIFVEEYVGGIKTIFSVVEVGGGIHGRDTKFKSEVGHWYNTREEAEEGLKKKLDACPFWRDIKND